MAFTVAHIPTWDEIDRAESYLVCCMFDEASYLASSILKRLLADHGHENELDDMLESAGMVLVQSLRELRKTSDILKELKLLFGSVTAVPVQVFLTGVCFQMLECPSIVQSFLEEFLNNWSSEDERYYSLSDVEAGIPDKERPGFRFSIDVDKYLEVVELYVITLLTMTLKDTYLAVSWVNNGMLPMEKRQEISSNRFVDWIIIWTRRISSMSRTSSSQTSSPLPNEYKTKLDFIGDQKSHNRHEVESAELSNERNTAREEILRLSRQRAPWFWWFPAMKLKFGSTQLVVPTSKILLASLLLLIYYFARKRRTEVKRFLAEKAMSMKKTVLDIWQLAFSYQVNPLAAVQALPTHGSR